MFLKFVLGLQILKLPTSHVGFPLPAFRHKVGNLASITDNSAASLAIGRADLIHGWQSYNYPIHFLDYTIVPKDFLDFSFYQTNVEYFSIHEIATNITHVVGSHTF